MTGRTDLIRAVQLIAQGTRLYYGWRPGQAAYNALHQLHPTIADEVHSTEADPFFDDARLPAFWNALATA